MLERLKKDIEKLSSQIIKWRRDFHRHPEVAFEEHRTSSVIKKYLESIGIMVRVCAGTGLVGVLEGQSQGRTVALRADMDALPLTEEGNKEYISQNPNAAHACGHDGHMAILLGTATLLSQYRDSLKGKVIFLFQPSEERFPGGAVKMINEGALEGVDAIFGLHLWKDMPTGAVGIVKGPMMAQPDSFSIIVKGKGGHGSLPQMSVDPIYIASQLVVNLQSIVSRNVDPLKPAVVSFGSIHGGTANNVIPCEVTMEGTVRTFDKDIQRLIGERLERIVTQTCETFGAESNLEYQKGYPALINPPDMADFVLDTAKKTLGAECIQALDPVMGGEDFAYFLQKIPGAFCFFGMGDGMKHPHHHPAFDMDERALPKAALLMTSLAMTYLNK